MILLFANGQEVRILLDARLGSVGAGSCDVV
jgi:hypothetical protein